MLKIFCLGALVLLTAAGCGKPAAAPADFTRPIKMFELQAGGIVPAFAFSGRILPNRQANIGFEVPGIMTAIHVKEGQPVSAGDLLAEIDPRDYTARAQAAAAQLEAAKLEAERAEALYAREATSRQRRDMASSNLQVAQSAYEQAAKALEETKITAPFAGMISRVLVEDIVNVQPKQTILILQDHSVLKVEADIPETMGALASHGLSLEQRNALIAPAVRLSFLPEHLFPAKLQEVAMQADPATRTYTATFTFDNPSNVFILPGMTASVLVHPRTEAATATNAFAVPTYLVIANTNQKPFVWRIDPATSTVVPVEVTLGNPKGDHIEIRSVSLAAGDKIAASGLHLLTAGQTVRPFEP